MKFLVLSERSDTELKEIVELARETSIGSALFEFGFHLEDLKADPVGHLVLSIMLDEVDREELSYWWQKFLVTGVSEMSVSAAKEACR